MSYRQMFQHKDGLNEDHCPWVPICIWATAVHTEGRSNAWPWLARPGLSVQGAPLPVRATEYHFLQCAGQTRVYLYIVRNRCLHAAIVVHLELGLRSLGSFIYYCLAHMAMLSQTVSIPTKNHAIIIKMLEKGKLTA